MSTECVCVERITCSEDNIFGGSGRNGGDNLHPHHHVVHALYKKYRCHGHPFLSCSFPHPIMSLSSKLSIRDLELKDKRVLIRYMI